MRQISNLLLLMAFCPALISGNDTNCKNAMGSEYKCVPMSHIDSTLDCEVNNDTLCNKGNSKDPGYCCKEKACPDKGCSDYGKNYTCFPAESINLGIMDCAPIDGKGIHLCNDNLLMTQEPCRCCNFKKNCTDVGCSTEHPGYQCLNEIDATKHPKKCLKHNTTLCESGEGMRSSLCE